MRKMSTAETIAISGGKEYCLDLGFIEVCATPNLKGTIIPPTAAAGEWEIKPSGINAVKYTYADQRNAEVASIDRYNTDRGNPSLYDIGRNYYGQ